MKRLYKLVGIVFIIILWAGLAVGCAPKVEDETDDDKNPPKETVLKYRRFSFEEASTEFAKSFQPLKPACATHYVAGGLNRAGDYGLVIAPTKPKNQNYIALVAYPWYFTDPKSYGIAESELEGLDGSLVTEPGFIAVKGLPGVPIMTEPFAPIVPVAFCAYTVGAYENGDIKTVLAVSGKWEISRILASSRITDADFDFEYLVYLNVSQEMMPQPPYKEGEAALIEYGFPVYYYVTVAFHCAGLLYSVRYPLYAEIAHWEEEMTIFTFDEAKTAKLMTLAERLAAVYVKDFFGDQGRG